MEVVDILHLLQQDPETVNDHMYASVLYFFSVHHRSD